MKRWLLIVTFCLFALVGFAATRDVAITTFLDWYLSRYAQNHFNSEFQYDGLSQEEGKWVFEHPRFVHEGKPIFSAEKATLGLEVQPLSRTVDVYVDVVSPTVVMGRPFEKAVDITAARSPRYRIIYFNQHVNVAKGIIRFTDEKTAIPPLAFSIDAVFGKRSSGSVHVVSTENEQATLTAKITQEKHGQSHVDVMIDKMEVAPFFELLHVCCPRLPQMAVQTGETSGTLQLDFYRDHKPSARGELLVKELQASYLQPNYVITAPEITIKLASDGDEEAEMFMPTSGHVDFGKGTAFTFLKEGAPFWTFSDIEGFFSFNTHEGGHCVFDAFCNHNNQSRRLNLEGNLRLSDTLPMSLTFKARATSDDVLVDDLIAHLSLRHLADQWHLGEIEIAGLSHEDFNFIKFLIVPHYPFWNAIEIEDGIFEASLLVYLNDFQPQEVKLEKLQANHAVIRLPQWDFHGAASSAFGSASIDLSAADPASSVNALLEVSGGRISIPGFGEKVWKFDGIDSVLKVHQGILQESVMRGMVAGMHGEMVLNEADPEQLVRLLVRGDTDELAPYLPKHMRKIAEKQFAHHKVVVEAKGKSISGEFEVDGTIRFQEGDLNDAPIYFSFLMDRPAESDRKPPHHVISEYLQTAGTEAIVALIPREGFDLASIAARGDLTLESNDVSRWSLFGYALDEGMFKAMDLPLDKYLSPFVFERDQMHVGGSGAFFGVFDSHSVKIDYDASDLFLKNNDFVIEIQKICRQYELCKPWVATHYFDLDSGRDYGVLPVSGGSYFEKNSGLLFTDIEALIFMQDNQVHVLGLSTYCNGLHFAGRADVDWSMPGEGIFEIAFAIDDISGKISQLQHLFSHFQKPFFFTQIPIEGNIALKEKGALLRFHFEPDDYTMESTIHGVITDGEWKSSNLDMMLTDMSLNFFYDHEASVMDFSDPQATLLVGSPNHFEEYLLTGDGVRFTNYAQQEAEFDLWVSDQKRDILRIAGKTHAERDLNDQLVVSIDLDKEVSHFGTVHPQEFQLLLSDSSDPLLFNLTFEFGLDAFFTDLQRFSRTGLLFLSRSLLKELNTIKKAEGQLVGSVNYSNSNSILEYQIHGREIAIDDHFVNTFEFIGNKRGDLWSIEQLQFDNISLSLDIHQDPHLWNINFLGARLGSSVLCGMEGIYVPEEDHLHGKINLCEIDIAALKEWPWLSSMIEERKLEGFLHASGTVDFVIDRTLPDLAQIDFKATGSLRDARVDGYSLGDIDGMEFAYNSTSGWKLGHVQTSMTTFDNPEPKVGFYLSSLHFDPKSLTFKIDDLHFSFFAFQLNWLVRHLENNWPDLFSSSVLDVIGNLKSQGTIQGSISLMGPLADSAHPFSHVHLSLADEAYRFEDTDYVVQNLQIDYDAQGVNLSCQTPYQQMLLSVKAAIEAPNYDRGEVIIADAKSIQQTHTLSPLSIRWSAVEPHGFSIEKVRGHLSGVTVDLAPDPEFQLNPHFHYLVGTVAIDFNQAFKLMTHEQAAGVAGAQLGQGYALYGRYGFDKSQGKAFGDRLYFQGELLGSSFDFMGYRFDHLSAHVDYQPLFATVTQMAISDESGQISIPQMTSTPDPFDQWQLFIPSLLVKEMRPSALETVVPSQNTIKKSLVIRAAEITDVYGYLADRNTFRGQGKLHFVNPQKKNFQHTIFAVPAELLTRIGLDLGALTPIRGNVEFEIADGKVVLKKFKDVYSKGRLSKFSLVHNGYPSYVDFDGNVHVQIKMKQYNLIFKLAELFNVTIGGTLSKPTYSLQKQPIGGNKGET